MSRRRGGRGGKLARLTGTGAAATLALAVLALGAVFAATAGPREALASRTQALHQTLGTTLPLAHSIEASSTWNAVSSSLASDTFGAPSDISLTQRQLGEITSQLHGDFNHGVVHLASPSQDWASMISGPHNVTTILPAVNGVGVRLEIGYRDPFSKYMRLVAGSYPGTPSPPAASGSGTRRAPPSPSCRAFRSW